jgi:hypothetical protein
VYVVCMLCVCAGCMCGVTGSTGQALGTPSHIAWKIHEHHTTTNQQEYITSILTNASMTDEGGQTWKSYIWNASYGFLWISMDSYRFLWIPMDFYGFIWIVMDSYGFLWILPIQYSSICKLVFQSCAAQIPATSTGWL